MTREQRKYAREEKDMLVARLFPPENISLGALSNETGISKSTLATKTFHSVPGFGRTPERTSSEAGPY